MEFTNLNQEDLVNITFMDVMKIISSDEPTPNQKLVYIYLLNVIMDTNERIDKLETTIKELTEPMFCPECGGDGYFYDEVENERTECENCCGEGYVKDDVDEIPY